MEKESDKIELRSEKVRNIIGEVPPSLVRYGTVIVMLILLALFLAAYFIPYPETMTVKGSVITEGNNAIAEIWIPYKYIVNVHKNMDVIVSFEGNNNSNRKLKVNIVDYKIYSIRGVHYFSVKIELGKLKSMYKEQKGTNITAQFLISNKSILKHIIK